MKKFILSLILTAAAVTAQPTIAQTQPADGKTETTAIASDNASKHLDDTLIDVSGQADQEVTLPDWYYSETYLNHQQNLNELWSTTARDIVISLSIALGAIVMLILLFRYLNRVRKYAVIEKAIENHYPLPDGLLNKSSSKVIYNVTPMPMPEAQPVVEHKNNVQVAPQPADANTGFNPLVEQFNWRALKGFPLVATGLGGMLFFLCVGSHEMVALCTVPVLLGCSKLFISYMDQRNAIMAARRYNQQQFTAQQQQEKQ